MQSIIILICLQIHTFLSTWNRLISVTKHNNQERDIMDAREIYYSLWEWSIQLWTHTATITCLLIYVLKQPKMYKVGKIRLAVIVIVKLVHFEGTFCLHWMLWPLCDILLAASLRALGKGSTLMLAGVGLRCSLSFLMLPFHSSQLWSKYHQSLRAVKLIKEGGTNHKTQPKLQKQVHVFEMQILVRFRWSLCEIISSLGWKCMAKQNKTTHKLELSGSLSIIFVHILLSTFCTHILTWSQQGGFLWVLKPHKM